MEKLFNIDKVGKSGVKFDMQKLEYLNQMHVRDKFTYHEDEAEKKECVDEFRGLLLDIMDPRMHSKIRSTSDTKLCKIMDMMKTRIHFYRDLTNHSYFFQQPQYDTSRAKKFFKRLRQPNEVKIEILEDLNTLFKEHQNSQTDPKMKNIILGEQINRICSLYLYENQDRDWKNEDVFFLLRYALSGNPVGAPTGDISEVIGLYEMIERCDNTIEYLKSI